MFIVFYCNAAHFLYEFKFKWLFDKSFIDNKLCNKNNNKILDHLRAKVN
jgi:hypothetical protein